MVSDDLFGTIALDALGFGIPAGNDPIGPEHVDGIVGDSFHHETELLLFQPQGLPGPPPFLGVAGEYLRRAPDQEPREGGHEGPAGHDQQDADRNEEAIHESHLQQVEQTGSDEKGCEQP